MAAPSPWVHGETEASSSLLMLIGGLQDQIHAGREAPERVLMGLANHIQASVTAAQQRNDAQPPPADVMAWFRLVDYFTRTNGDVWQTIEVPGEILLKEVHFNCDDDGAQKEWERLWHGIFDIDQLAEEFFFETETYGQCFPLEVWDGNTPTGIAMLEPASMWVGRALSTQQFQYALMTPQDFELQKLKDMVHDVAYSSFVVDQNVQTSHLSRIPIKPERLTPIYGRKFAFQRYAVPPVIRASRNIMHRQILDELRRGTIEGYINQLILFTVGSEKDLPGTVANKIKRVNNLITSASTNRTGVIVSDYTTKADVVAPKVVDQLLATETWMELTQAIFRDLGMSLFVVSGEVPGLSSRGGQSTDVDVQLAIERWKYKRRKILAWFKQFSKKYAQANKSKALEAHLPDFTMAQIGIEQTRAIKERIMPLLQAGVLSTQTALQDSGYAYKIELANKKAERQDSELFQVRTTFAQTTRNGNSGEKTTETAPRGKPPKAQSPTLVKQMSASIAVAGDWSGEIEAQFSQMIASAASKGPNARESFGSWMRQTLAQKLEAAYRDGFAQGGGLGKIDEFLMQETNQGIRFHRQHLEAMLAELSTTETPESLRSRALSYASASRTLYMMGYQQAMQSHGAKSWQRIVHPELSESGPCGRCIADASVIHPITEAYFEFHPHQVCSTQTANFYFGNRVPVSSPLPSYGVATRHILRRHPVGERNSDDPE